MAKDKKPSSCLGLFLKSSIAVGVALSLLTVGTVALGVKFMDWELAHWTTVSGWNSYPMLALFAIFGLAFVTGLGVAAFVGAAKAFLRAGRETKPASRARPQSHRKTTI